MMGIKTLIRHRLSPQTLYNINLFQKKTPLFLMNVLFQKVFRLDADCPFLKHYTTRVIHGRNIRIDIDAPENILKSFFSSGGCYIQAKNGIEIGTGTRWAVNVVMVSETYDETDLSKVKENGPIRIGKRCWLGANTVILPSIELGDGTIVGANSVVTKSFPEGNCVLVGVPARIMKKLHSNR